MKDPDTIIDVQNITVGYPRQSNNGIKFLRQASENKMKNASIILRDINFKVNKGEVLGIIGRNGCGKTTLLRVIAGILPPLSGRLVINAANVASMLSVGAGFNQEYSGYDNIIMNASLLGIKREEVESNMDKILEFADIGDAIYDPIQTYSSGMRARLGFAIYGILQSELILIDETLSVGDKGFEQKSRNLIHEMQNQGRTMLLVSHSLGLMEALCSRIIWLNDGVVEADGNPEVVVEEYSKSFPKTHHAAEQLNNLKGRSGTLELYIDDISFLDHKKRPIDHLITGQQTYIKFRFNKTSEFSHRFQSLSFGCGIFTESGRKLFRVATEHVGFQIDYSMEQFYLTVDLGELPLNEGDYFLGYRLVDGDQSIDYLPKALDFSVLVGDFYGKGVEDTHSPLLIKHEWFFEKN